MGIFKILFLAIVTLFLVLVLEKHNKEFSVFVLLIAGILIFISVFENISEIIDTLDGLASRVELNKTYLQLLIKAVGIVYLVEIVKNVCIDSGNTSLGTKVEMAGKATLVMLTLPLITNVITLIEGIV